MKESVAIQLAKPNREVIGELRDAKSSRKLKLGQISELNLSIPYYVERHHQHIVNPYFFKVKEKYQLKVFIEDEIQWYTIDRVSTDSSNGKVKQITAYSTGQELSGEKLYNWAGVELVDGEVRTKSLTIDDVAPDLISNTAWSINHIDSSLLDIYRDFEFQNTSVLSALYEVAKTFNAVIEFDDANRQISFYHTDNYGQQTGLFFSYERYLKSISDEVMSREIITKMKPYGKEGLTIQEVNPTGTNEIIDYSYWLYPFKRDEFGNVIESSGWLSDSLCHALLDYNDLVSQKESDYQSLITTRDSLTTQITDKENTIEDKKTELIIVQDNIQLAQTNDQDASTYLQQEDDLQSEINTLESDVDSLNSQLSTTLQDMQTISDSLAMDNNFTQAQLNELQIFNNTMIWENQNYSKAEDLLEGAREELKKHSKPKAKIDISLVDLFKIAEAKDDLKKLKLGDKVYIHYKYFEIDVESQIIEMDVDHNNGDIRVTIANTKDIERENDEEWFSEILYQNTQTFGSVIQNKDKWNKVSDVENSVTDLLEGKWDAAKREIVSGVNESVTINNKGITIKDSNDPQKFIRQTNSVIGLTEDGGNTFRTAITPSGVYASEVVGKLIAGVNLQIENESGDYVIDGNGLNMTSNGGQNKISISPSEGIKIEKKEGTVWDTNFYLDSNNGQIRVKDIVIEGGTIEWDNVIAPDYNEIRGSKPPSDADVTETKLTETTVYAPYLQVNSAYIAGLIEANQIRASDLHVDSANIDGTLTASQIDTTGLIAEGVAVTKGDASIQTTIANKSGDELPALTFFNDSAGYSISMIYSSLGLEIIGTNKLTLGGNEVATVNNLVAKFG